MAAQTTFRLPSALARLLTRQAKQRGVSKSQLVREALEGYLQPASSTGREMMVREGASTYVGSLSLDTASRAGDPLAAMIRERNWRE